MPNGGSGIIEKYFLQMKAAVKKKEIFLDIEFFPLMGIAKPS